MTLPEGRRCTDVAVCVVVSTNREPNACCCTTRNDPTGRHWQAVLQIIQYLLGTKDLSLTYERGPDFTLSVYTDANFVEKADDRRSVSGVVVTLDSATVSWLSSTQKIVTLSTTEAEYVALGDGVKEALFAKAVACLLYTSPSPRDGLLSRMPSSA